MFLFEWPVSLYCGSGSDRLCRQSDDGCCQHSVSRAVSTCEGAIVRSMYLVPPDNQIGETAVSLTSSRALVPVLSLAMNDVVTSSPCNFAEHHGFAGKHVAVCLPCCSLHSSASVR